ncbi:peptide chain release factor N(5)-glutamine methyltransferase [Candidatus Kaiserbacteria bacterium]|nr:MAG: peptide chain release factor N(5)-glutamine methyltransferase [Candidatus Kaiserbacteria bacterium]
MNQDEEWLLKEKYHGEKSEGFSTDCMRLKNGEPLAYVIGSVAFLGTTIFLDIPTTRLTGARPLIPRTETEFWVEKAIAEMSMQKEKSLHVLDLCAGSGCVGVAVLHALPESHVDFGEIAEHHHPTIFKNLTENTLDPSRSCIFGGSLFDEITGTYDYILSNPPYIDKNLGRVAPEVETHEPALALYGGKDGMIFIETIIVSAPEHLSPTGVLYLEHEPEQVTAIHAFARMAGLTPTTHPDQYGVLRYTRFTRDT